MSWDDHKQAKEEIDKIVNNFADYNIIHYACEGFEKVEDGQSSRIAAIAVFSCRTLETTSFDLPTSAKFANVIYDDIEEHMDEVEGKLLERFYEFLLDHRDYMYLHWDMTNFNYGFQHLEDRYRVLLKKEPPYRVSVRNLVNISELLKRYYGYDYVPSHRIPNLNARNPQIGSDKILSGVEEGLAYEKKEYKRIHASLLRKVRFFYDVLVSAKNKTLIVDNDQSKLTVAAPQEMFEKVKDTWWYALISFAAGIVIGNYLGS